MQASRDPAGDAEALATLLDRCCGPRFGSDPPLAPAEAARLNELLATHAWARARYLDCMAVEAELHAGHATSTVAEAGPQADAVESPGAAVGGGLDDALLGELMPQGRGLPSHAAGSAGARATRRSSRPLALAASLLGVAVASSLLTASLLRPTNRAEAAQTLPNGTEASGSVAAINASAGPEVGVGHEAIAEITATRNCRWRDASVGCGDTVHAGQRLDLLQGVAQLLFTSGVTVLLEGPATIEFDGAGGMSMLAGRLCVDSPEDADSLQIKAGRMMLAQRGASVGVLADDAGGGEVHVFRGEVRATVLSNTGQPLQRCSWSGGAGGRLRPAAKAFTPIRAHDDLFVRTLLPGAGPQDGLYAVESFDYPAGPISAQNGGFGWAGPWTEIESMPGVAGQSTNCVAKRSLHLRGLPPAGAHFQQTGQANRVRRVLSTSYKGVFDVAGLVENRDAHRLIGKEGHTIYIAVLQRVSKTGDVFYGLELNRGDGNGNRVLCIGNGAEGAGYAVTSNYNNHAGERGASLGEETTGANLIVIRIDYGPNDQDRAVVYRNPASLVDEFKCRPAAELSGDFSFDRVSFGNFEGTKIHQVDELRIGTSFRVVTGQRSFLQMPLAAALPATNPAGHPAFESAPRLPLYAPARGAEGLLARAGSERPLFINID